MKTLTPVAGVVLVLHGVSEELRSLRCIRSGRWPARLQDVEELDSAIIQQYQRSAQEGDRP